MTIETLKIKIDNQNKVIKELTIENEELYHQYNHLIIRNGKMLKRIDDFQTIIDDLHIRIEELQLINGNMLQLNDKLRRRNSLSLSVNEVHEQGLVKPELSDTIESEFDVDKLQDRWKNYPGQKGQNGPNLRKQVLMLIHLYTTSSLRAAELFNRAGVGGVTGARYVSMLKNFELIRYTGARKKGHYEITRTGMDFIEGAKISKSVLQTNSDSPLIHDESPAKVEKVNLHAINADHNDL